ncbi:MAG: prepilin-type N-terminal cleavage/methylation domain-containing protein [Candidatus Pacebacteria bacterium]|nr:prepilin-type N-terminal cleavage/methylation domain-containing protein [Candidatus Paceibacterota bacterium]
MKIEKAFTLVEVLVAMAIFAIAVVLIFTIYFTSQKFYQKTETKAEILQNARVVLERISRELRQTQEIVTVLPQTPDNPSSPPTNEIEFQDGHTPSPYSYLGSDYYYIRYYVSDSAGEINRQYKVYCFDNCLSCLAYFKWNDTQMVDGVSTQAHGCPLEDRVIGEFVQEIKFWGAGNINIYLKLQKLNEQMDFQTNVFGRNF